ncbi:hypothetical protein MKX03_018665 [Papaver bracteatum]|nr:hypothetical protein MKX03_018665 [Papaver bracteatum]
MNLQKGGHVKVVVDMDMEVSCVEVSMVWMVTWLGIVKLETGRISVTTMEIKATWKETARIVLKASSMCEVFLIFSMCLYVYNDVEQIPVVVLPSAQVYGDAFVEQYYHILHQSPELVNFFYQDLTVLSRPGQDGVMSTVSTMDDMY